MKILIKDITNQKNKGIYFIKNLKTNQVYVGSTPKSSFRRRFKQHLNSLIKGSHENSHLQRSYLKYGSSNFIFYIKEILEDSSPEEILKVEQHYLENEQNLFNKHLNAFYPPPSKKGGDEKRKESIKKGFEFYHKYKNKDILLEDIPVEFKGFVIGKSNYRAWNTGLTKEDIDYSFLKGISKTKTDSYFEGRKVFKEKMRDKSKPINIFDYQGKYLMTFRSASDIVDYSKSDNKLPLIVQSDKPRKSKNGFVPIEYLEINNILNVLKGKKRSYKGLIFSYESQSEYILKPCDIKYAYTKWSQCYFLNHSRPEE